MKRRRKRRRKRKKERVKKTTEAGYWLGRRQEQAEEDGRVGVPQEHLQPAAWYSTTVLHVTVLVA